MVCVFSWPLQQISVFIHCHLLPDGAIVIVLHTPEITKMDETYELIKGYLSLAPTLATQKSINKKKKLKGKHKSKSCKSLDTFIDFC